MLPTTLAISAHCKKLLTAVAVLSFSCHWPGDSAGLWSGGGGVVQLNQTGFAMTLEPWL